MGNIKRVNLSEVRLENYFTKPTFIIFKLYIDYIITIYLNIYEGMRWLAVKSPRQELEAGRHNASKNIHYHKILLEFRQVRFLTSICLENCPTIRGCTGYDYCRD
jgi:hypothetical protein